jgi:methionine-rich copper-binding protein CopC
MLWLGRDFRSTRSAWSHSDTSSHCTPVGGKALHRISPTIQLYFRDRVGRLVWFVLAAGGGLLWLARGFRSTRLAWSHSDTSSHCTPVGGKALHRISQTIQLYFRDRVGRLVWFVLAAGGSLLWLARGFRSTRSAWSHSDTSSHCTPVGGKALHRISQTIQLYFRDRVGRLVWFVLAAGGNMLWLARGFRSTRSIWRRSDTSSHCTPVGGKALHRISQTIQLYFRDRVGRLVWFVFTAGGNLIWLGRSLRSTR